MKFYLPNFEDLVDPEYDFLADRPSPNRHNRWLHDKMAHDFFHEPIFDGMLVSKASLSPTSEKYIWNAGGIRNYTRLDPTIPIMGDCGAFTYLLTEKPIYTVQQTLDYYQYLGFDFGVSLDHLSFVNIDMLESALKQGKIKEKWWEGKTDEQIQEERFELTLRNAQEFLDLHRQQKLTFRPIGIAQGNNPERYYEAVDQLVKMGYKHIALGGLIKSSDSAIVAILERLQPLIKQGIEIHIFGVARLSLVPEFTRLGVTSADTAAPLRKAFLGETNYWTLSGKKYQAIRVPEAHSGRTKRGVFSVKKVLQDNNQLSPEILLQLEQNALNSLRAYDRGRMGLEDTLEAVLKYDRLYGDDRNHREAYRNILDDKPWQTCECSICNQIGIDVIIFRGNNRNRRRGFHNVKVFYELFQKAHEHTDAFLNIPKQLLFDEVSL